MTIAGGNVFCLRSNKIITKRPKNDIFITFLIVRGELGNQKKCEASFLTRPRISYSKQITKLRQTNY